MHNLEFKENLPLIGLHKEPRMDFSGCRVCTVISTQTNTCSEHALHNLQLQRYSPQKNNAMHSDIQESEMVKRGVQLVPKINQRS